MKKILVIITVGLLFATCTNNSSYEKEEFIVIQDITNNFLQEILLTEEVRVIFDGEVMKYEPFNDTLHSRVYFSDALLPISQVKKDFGWMFKDSYLGSNDSAIFYGIINSKQFYELKYRNFDKTKIELKKPLKQFNRSQERIITGERYAIFNFSRVCFDAKRENGVVVIEYTKGYENGTATGYRNALLIKKQNGKWVYIKKRKH